MEPLKVRWRNFRGFEDSGTISFPRITLLIGRNNVGKTSAYAPLLLLKQTLDARNPHTALLSRGDLFDAGTFADFVSKHDERKKVSFSLTLSKNDLQPELRGTRRQQRASTAEITFGSRDGISPILDEYRLRDQDGASLVYRKRQADEQSFAFTSALLPTAKSVGRPQSEISLLKKALREEQPNGFQFSGIGGLLIPRTFREDVHRWEKVRGWFNAASELYHLHSTFNSAIERLLREIAYLGPLRSLPKRTYRLEPETPLNVGRSGEFAPELLFRNDEMKGFVDAWLEKLGYGNLQFASLGDEYFQVSIEREGGLAVNIAHSGVGLSQLLPLLVQGATAPSGAMIIAQQPEIHLNPAQQCVITDFLVEASLSKRVVIETHSEHVLLRLRRRIAEGLVDGSEVAIYYLGGQNGTEIQEVGVTDQGHIAKSEWPEGFFSEQLDDSFALAAAQHRAR